MDREGTLHNLKARKTFIVRRSRDWPASREGSEDENESRGSRVVQRRRVLDACLRLRCELIAASTVRASAVAQLEVRFCPIARFAYVLLFSTPMSPARKSIFRPCIDLHDGQVKQIVGGTLSDDSAQLKTNFVARRVRLHTCTTRTGVNFDPQVNRLPSLQNCTRDMIFWVAIL